MSELETIGDLSTEIKEISLKLSERHARILTAALYGLGDVVQGNFTEAIGKITEAQNIIALEMSEGEEGVDRLWNLLSQIHHPFCRHSEKCNLNPDVPLSELYKEHEIPQGSGGYL